MLITIFMRFLPHHARNRRLDARPVFLVIFPFEVVEPFATNSTNVRR